jgi:hypothetical protein
MAEPSRLTNRDPVHTRSVPRAEVDRLHIPLAETKRCVSTRHEIVVDADRARRVPTDRGFLRGEVDLFQAETEPKRHAS